MKFTKMQAYGNDYIYINAIDQDIKNPNDLAVKLSKYHYGIGSDGLVLICKSKVADFKMRIFNVDGSEGEMCGNALRSVAKYVYVKHLTKKTKFNIETLGGIKEVSLIIENNEVVNIKACIGTPIFDPSLIPVNINKNKVIMEDITIKNKTFKISCLSWGNPHTVIFVEDLEKVDIQNLGPLIENYFLFPKKTNVTFAQIIDYQTIKIREWERGCYETLGCATGCASAHVIAHILGLVSDTCKIIQRGGALNSQYIDNVLTMMGPSEIVFEGEIFI